MASDPVYLEGVGQTILVLSGKGGVGKSTTSVQIAFALHALGHKVGVLDVDLCGPSMARMLGVEDADVLTSPQGKWMPVYVDTEKRLGVVSLAFFLSSKKDAVIWRGPKKNSMIKQMLSSVAWDVDYLIIDTPPGTSDEHITVMENIKQCRVMGGVLVTTPQMLSIDDVAKELSFCRTAQLPILGVIENMAGYVCPNCSECSNLLAYGGGEDFADKSNIPFLGRIPIDPNLTTCTEKGENYMKKFSQSPIAATYTDIVKRIVGNTVTEMET